MRKTAFLLLILFTTLCISSCSTLFQRAYFATSPNINCFEKEKEKNLKVALSPNNYGVQSNLALAKSFGLSLGVNGGFRGQINGEAAGIYYTDLNPKNYFEVQAGYGYFYNQYSVPEMPWDLGAMIGHGTRFQSDVNTKYHKLFIQPTYVHRFKKVNLGFTVKLSANYFDKYYYYRCFSENPKDDYIIYNTYSTADFKNIWGFACEPAMRVQFNSSFFIQVSGLFMNDMRSSVVYYQKRNHSHFVYEYEDGEMSNPQHLYFVFTLGYEIKFGKKKEPLK